MAAACSALPSESLPSSISASSLALLGSISPSASSRRSTAVPTFAGRGRKWLRNVLVSTSSVRYVPMNRRLGGPQQLDEERGAVEVPPLEIVDEQHGGAMLAQACQQLAQSAEGTPAELL